MTTSSDDFSLISDCLNGNPQAWNLFVRRFSKLIYYSINKTLKSYACHLQQEDVEDIFHGVFLSFLENDHKKLRQFKGLEGCTLPSWIRLISMRQTIDFLRKQKQHMSINAGTDDTRLISETVEDGNPSVDHSLELSQIEKIMQKTIMTLPASDRLFMKLYYEKELPSEKIAKIMNISINTVYSKKKRIRDKLGEMIKDG